MVGALVLASAGSSASLGKQSFYDDLHGWRATERSVDETNDGGRTWRRISAERADLVLRTGLKAGITDTDNEVFWTNGSGFYRSRKITAPAAGFGQFLFWWLGSAVYRVTPWPFPHLCVDWTRYTAECVHRDASGRRRVAKFTASLVVSVPEGRVGDAATIPAGVVVVNRATRLSDRPYVATARWLTGSSQPRVVRQLLPSPSPPLTTCQQTLAVEWPRIVVSACTNNANQAPVPFGHWLSVDGGLSWALYGATLPAGQPATSKGG